MGIGKSSEHDFKAPLGPPGSHGDRGGEVGPVWAPTISGSAGATSTLDDVKDRLKKADLYAQESRDLILLRAKINTEMIQGISQRVQYLHDLAPTLARQIQYLHQMEVDRQTDLANKRAERRYRWGLVRSTTLWLMGGMICGLAIYGLVTAIAGN